MKYEGVDIEIFFSGAARASRAPTSRIALTQVEYVFDQPSPDMTACQSPFHLYTPFSHLHSDEAQPVHDSHIPDMPAIPNDLSNDMDLHLATGALFTFNSRSPSISPSSLASSSSPSPSPLEFPDELTFSLSYVDITEANASYDPETSGAFPVMSPVSQLMHDYGFDVSEYPKQQWA